MLVPLFRLLSFLPLPILHAVGVAIGWIVYLSSAPNQRFRGKVQGIAWAVKPEGEIDLPPSGVPYVKRELNWVRVAQRFPVRIEVEDPDPDLFRMGASAVAIIQGSRR